MTFLNSSAAANRATGCWSPGIGGFGTVVRPLLGMSRLIGAMSLTSKLFLYIFRNPLSPD